MRKIYTLESLKKLIRENEPVMVVEAERIDEYMNSTDQSRLFLVTAKFNNEDYQTATYEYFVEEEEKEYPELEEDDYLEEYYSPYSLDDVLEDEDYSDEFDKFWNVGLDADAVNEVLQTTRQQDDSKWLI